MSPVAVIQVGNEVGLVGELELVLRAELSNPENAVERKKESLTRGLVEDIGSTVGLQSYMSRVRRGDVPGCVSISSRTAMSR